MKKYLFVVSCLLLASLAFSGCKKNPKLFAGGFTKDNEKGLALFDFEEKAISLNLLSEIEAGPSPSFLCFSQRHNLIYALNEVSEFNGKQGSGITTLSYDPGSGNIDKMNEILVPYGGGCYISVSADSGFLLVASYSSSSVAVVRLDDNGIPEKVTDTILYVADAPYVSHPHMIAPDPAGKHIYLTDLGLDRILIYDLDKSTGKLVPVPGGIISFPEGSGPRHFVFNKKGSKMYVINELGSTIIVLNVDENGLLYPVQTLSTLKEGFTGKNQCAEILFGKDGKFIYGSNRGENSIVVFKVDEGGMLTLAGHSSCGGDWPRNFVIDPEGRYLISGNQGSDNIAIFKINQKTGLPEGPLSIAIMKQPAYLEFWR